MKAKFTNKNPQVSGFEIGKLYSYRDLGIGIEVFYDEDDGMSLVMGYILFHECFTSVDEKDEIQTWSDKGELICPYCGHHYNLDHTEGLGNNELEFDDVEFVCPKCEETYLVSQRVHFTYETFKIETK